MILPFGSLRSIAAHALAVGLMLVLIGCAQAPNPPAIGASSRPGANGGNDAAADTGASQRQADLALYNRVLNRVRASYVEPVGENQLLANSLKGMLTGLDPHSDYLNESEYQDLLDESEGEFA
ncbi:MAG: hypothetical protein ACLPL5_12590, partial [Stellaceae bacterium]